MNEDLLVVSGLTICFDSREGVSTAVNDVSFSLKAGEVLGIVGESGSGKTVACYSLLGLLPSPPAKIVRGQAFYRGQNLFELKGKALRSIRGGKIAMVFQDPMTSLNPYRTIGSQLTEAIRSHKKVSKKAAKQSAINALEEVGINSASARMGAFPHEFSGGMRQRVMIAMALITEPEILIADEPTTALDVTVQAQVLSVIREVQARRHLAVIFISHDLAVVKNLADKVIVMSKGCIVESGESKAVFNCPEAAYTKQLLASVPVTAKPLQYRLNSMQPLLQVLDLCVAYESSASFWGRRMESTVIHEVSFTLHAGEILGIVGESGSGKTTLTRALLQLLPVQSGTIVYEGADISLRRGKKASHLADMQFIFQDPYASLNPRMTVFDIIAEPLLLYGIETPDTVLSRINELLDEVGLERSAIRKYPHEFSGGQRQRVAIARAIASKPKLIIADEPVSALDVTIQSQILALLLELVKRYGVSLIFVSHDLSVVRYVADNILVMKAGEILEQGDVEQVFSSPQAEYTQGLIAAIPQLD